MIINESKLKTPKWSKNDINRWADFIELLCLYSKDHLISKDDVIHMFTEGSMEDLQRGESNHSNKYDKLVATIDDYYDIIVYRDSIQRAYYPFKIEDRQCISLKDDRSEKNIHYIFLLLCSSICFMDNISIQKITHTFEKYCRFIMENLMPYNAQTELFGTTRSIGSFNGTLRSRIAQLAKKLGAQTTKSMDKDEKYDRIHAGDGGIDIVSFLPLDHASHIPFALGQCACSYKEWVNKQHSISHDIWSARIAPIAPFWRYMYVPFSCHNASDQFENLTDIDTCLIDRSRILKILDLHDELFSKMKDLNIEGFIDNKGSFIHI